MDTGTGSVLMDLNPTLAHLRNQATLPEDFMVALPISTTSRVPFTSAWLTSEALSLKWNVCKNCKKLFYFKYTDINAKPLEEH